ncbi:MAG: OmpA family protein, partial [Bacteroidales bacterium]
LGGLDIYQSVYNEEKQTWGEATNLGPEINTPFNEETPAISEDGETLYFSSQGHYNMGGFDIFYSNKIGENEWSTPVNIGYPINTTDDDLFFYPVKQGSYAYISKFDENGFGQEDIIHLEIFSPDHPFQVHVHGQVSLQDNQVDFNKKDFRVHVLDSSIAEVIDTLFLDEETGKFNTELKPGTYKFIFKSNEYKQKVKTLIIPEDYPRSELSFNVELIPLAVTTGEYITIKSIFFEFDGHTLTKEAKIELERLHNLMVKYPSLYIEVIGHTDAIGSAKYNIKLSIKRARSVIDYLTKKGIEQKRFVAKGAGKAEPIAVNTNHDGSDNPEGRKFNRRVEMKILKSDKKLIIKDDVNIPENLKHRDLTYCIFIFKQKEKLPADYFNQYEELKNYPVKEYQNSEYYYTLGSSKEKSELIKIFNTLLELGFDDAEIISSYDLENILHENKTRSEVMELKSDHPLYGIQIKALQTPVDLKMFEPLDVKEIKCLDGFYRYICGEFESFSQAKVKLNKIIEQGYTDAFIVNVNQLK